MQDKLQDTRVSEAVVHRLPKYYRYLVELEMMGIERVSSSRMSKEMGLNASQIRRDLNCFGGFGQQGYGYLVKRLKQEIRKILGIGVGYKAVLVGAGNIGQALLNYRRFADEGYHIVAAFDADEDIVGQVFGGVQVQSMNRLAESLKRTPVDIGILSVPKPFAQHMADMLIGLGVSAIWNFAPVDVQVPEGKVVENVHMSDSLYILSYHMREQREGNTGKNESAL
jgi:redox-sensing transcriptional repressor